MLDKHWYWLSKVGLLLCYPIILGLTVILSSGLGLRITEVVAKLFWHDCNPAQKITTKRRSPIHATIRPPESSVEDRAGRGRALDKRKYSMAMHARTTPSLPRDTAPHLQERHKKGYILWYLDKNGGMTWATSYVQDMYTILRKSRPWKVTSWVFPPPIIPNTLCHFSGNAWAIVFGTYNYNSWGEGSNENTTYCMHVSFKTWIFSANIQLALVIARCPFQKNQFSFSEPHQPLLQNSIRQGRDMCEISH